jgi:ADP-heptose:LPS heptosyltransferase
LKKILIIQTASIGDVILATPLLEALHRQYPDALIDFMVKRGTETLFTGHPFLRKLYVWDKAGAKLKNFYLILKEIQSERYDLLINIQRFFLTGFLTAFSRARERVGFSKNPLSLFYTKRVKHRIGESGIHEVDRNLSLVKHLVNDPVRRPVLYPSAHDLALVSQYKTHRYICIAPASLWYTKQYPSEQWIAFMKKLPEGLHVYLLGSGSDQKLCDEIIRSAGHRQAMSLAGKLTLLQTAGLLRDAAMNFVNDSAPMHLASAVNAPVTAIFCSTVPDFGFGPLSDGSWIVETAEPLDCRPCGLHGRSECPEKHFDCAYTIKLDQLLDRIH